MTEKTCCHRCGKDLSTVEEIHAAEGMLFCSEDCAIGWQIDLTIATAKEQAQEWYDEYAEIVSPANIGIAKEAK